MFHAFLFASAVQATPAPSGFPDPLPLLEQDEVVPSMPAGLTANEVHHLISTLVECRQSEEAVEPTPDKALGLLETHGGELADAVASVVATTDDLAFPDLEAAIVLISQADDEYLSQTGIPFVVAVARLAPNFAFRGIDKYRSLNADERHAFAVSVGGNLQCRILSSFPGLLSTDDGIGFAQESLYSDSERVRICAADTLLDEGLDYVADVEAACASEPGDLFVEAICSEFD